MRQKLPANVGPIRAAQYLRMSTEYQDQSLEVQAAAIAQYASRRGFEIVRSYEDAAKSGLTIAKRPRLQQLFADVLNGDGDFDAVLVYDVSRWGRFQDIDESAHYEFLCRQMGVAVHYCAEPFENDGTGMSSLLKSMKRVMAAEYSRDLASRIYIAQQHHFRRGFRVSGATPYGYCRMIIDAAGEVKGCLGPGGAKFLKSDRTRLAPGPPHEVAIIRRIFDYYTLQGLGLKEIAQRLNVEGHRTRSGHPWHESILRAILRNETYIGTNVWGRYRQYPLQKGAPTPPDTWLRVPLAFEALVDPTIFALAQDIRAHRAIPIGTPANELLERLAALVVKYGEITRQMVYLEPDVFHSPAYRAQFGSMRLAFRQLGFRGLPRKARPPRRAPKLLRWRLLSTLIEELRRRGIAIRRDDTSRHVIVGEKLRVSVLHIRDKYKAWSAPGWHPSCTGGDITLLARTPSWSEEPVDFYLIGEEPLDWPQLPPPAVDLIPRIEPYRLPSLEAFYVLAEARINSSGPRTANYFDA